MGKVYIVGAGPGDPDLLTIKALKAIQTADVILYDRLVNKQILQHAKEGADLIYCGKLPDYHMMKQETINYFLVKYAKKGKTVVRLKGGDPFVFGRGGEEAQTLAEHGVAFEIVPGITSGIAAAAYAGIPVTHREASSNVAFVTGHYQKEENFEEKWKALATGIDTLVIYMGIKNVKHIERLLIENGRDPSTPAAFIHWGTTDKQNTVLCTVGTLAGTVESEKIENPSLIVIGDVVQFSSQLNWFEPQLTDPALSEAL
ncbi:uroporphyrinogen-III C-methyltransferase [Bacillus haynesii]|uniref:uroporphyrinogen-III C-methyltransferase n=1 Tax=Bacillus haynesii TaxID=1925021 RepID=UPI00159309B6|nr:uroporphyrinogen-III C-methyltransferase [Bacillus haynesii]NVB33462.1 uroporphyrinogen-III C-methyltransferase [Bacillus licheniformis]MCY7815837.1 uroporphyrinogen-III C-methyltransferase [Bacillus haynesii]MCY8240517.1 uroporphyrinogen-III C-methyltransferase [Bacillus haynesii]MCY8661441.1 uroporphyrinogen-III C-methyltransferase [Bacillus haynesii]MEC0671741.1 uroporphyrinogen-III C-methyltransferase [Bacillus haynesii]